ncbi:NAD(P)-dependent dehydrogenase, short-chain alcohol dehydrogenase family [Chryseobacterium taichungense]|uniref:NAD(P)-dependent dehydrogenase, short-chain alcohol dehydrogenase family n=1 Tax=Chryseobacterium taichungense TaxID=295069 RepID=A0A1H8D9N4_9FLAO|nr:SDR family NAD(P)-dependent oxidoreductase [Chryseobacterium taichungense]SEN03825.1 NAD(P)-dependent dehydrogenase, short-chain alcohol dehydrogenase family [Chryseobacterium taichungense]
MNFTNKNVVITGGSAGIGLATAKTFIEKGANVLITGRNADSLHTASVEINSPNLKTLASDISKLADIATLEKEIAESGNKVDVLVLNAGIAKQFSIEETTEEVFDDLFNINVKGLFFTLQNLIPHLAEGASVILISSGVSVSGYAQMGAYAATKSAVDAIARTAAIELADRKIRVNTVAPGLTDTPMNRQTPEDIKNAIAAAVPLKRIGEAEEIANAIVFLASSEASYISGSYLSVDGGVTIRR